MDTEIADLSIGFFYGHFLECKLQVLNFSKHTRNIQAICPTTTTSTSTTTVLRPFVRDNPGEPVPEETFIHPPSWSSSNLYQLLASTTIHNIIPIQFTRLTIFLHNLSLVYVLVCSPPPHIPHISLTNQYRLFATHAHTIAACFAVVPRLYHLFLISVSTLYLGLYLISFTLTSHIHLTILISARWSATSFFFPDSQVSLPCSILLCTQLLHTTLS